MNTQSKRLPLFYTVTAVFWFALYAYVPYVSPYSELLGADLRFIGLIVGAYGFTQMAIRFPLGILSDRLGKRKIFVLSGLFFAAVSGFIVFFFPHPTIMLLSRSLGGVAAASWVAFAILGASYYHSDEATKSVGYLNAANAAGRMLAFLAGGLIARWLGVPYAFLLSGIAGLIGLAAGLGIKEKAQNVKTPPKFTDLIGVARNPMLLSTSFLAILSQYIMFATAFGFTPLLAYGMGASPFTLGMLGLASAVPGLIVSPLAGTVLPRKIGARNTIALGFGMSALGCVLIAFTGNVWQLFAVQVFISTGNVIAYTLLMGLSIKDMPGERRATAMGFFQAVYGLGMFMGPFVTGWLAYEFGLNMALPLTGAVGVLGMGAVFWFVRRGFING
ncbi:MAG: MFS transporter [Defluviitaleaceae bacterium]|nr:MFS transporter [Defluviitaleaceae bacterium]